MKTTRRELIGKTFRWTFIGTIAASLIEGVTDPKTGRCDCLFCRAERVLARKGRRT